MFCAKCNDAIPAGEEMEHMGQILCEDCYIVAIEPPRTCDVTAVHAAKMARKLAGQEGTDGLTDIQKAIYDLIKEKGKVLPTELASHFKLPQWQIERHLTTLRHCELTKGAKIDGKVYITLMEEDDPGVLKMGE